MESFTRRISEGPSFLFLGQKYLKLGSKKDLFLSQVLKKYGNGDTPAQDYNDILNSEASRDPSASISWMLTRCMHIPLPKALELISGFAWSGVYTSAFDAVIDRAFRTEWRDVQPIFNTKYKPSEPRSRHRLHIYHLFGSLLANEEKDGLPPLTESDFWARQEASVVLANRLPELITPLGSLVIEGYGGNDDWFTPEKIYPTITRLNKGQAFLFSSNDRLEADPKIKNLIKSKKLVAFRESLAEALLRGKEAGEISIGEQPDHVDYTHQIRIESKLQTIPNNIWKLINGTADILTESLFIPVEKQSDDKEYSDFRQFLFESSYKQSWSGYSRGFVFDRSYEIDLLRRINKKLKDPDINKKLVILHGQTGSGKSVTLGHLAYKTQQDGKYPVIYLEGSSLSIRKESIDIFCEWAQKNYAKSILIVWDGMQNPENYQELQYYLQSRGRKVQIIGSCYNMSVTTDIDAELIKAPSSLTNEEIVEFAKFLSTFGISLEYIKKQIVKITDSFLVFLYRLLPPSRKAIQVGVEKELSFAESIICDRAEGLTIREEYRSLLGDLFYEAGIIEEKPILEKEEKDFAGETIDQLTQLVGLIMVPGQYNISCPLELLMRVVGMGFSEDFVNILKAVDILRWSEDASGGLVVGPRSSLEAEIITRNRISGAQFEIEYVTALISEIQCEDIFEINEIQFAIDIIQAVGPNSSRSYYYKEYFINIADCLEGVRKTSGISNPRLMLQESTLLRESAKSPLLDKIESLGILKKSAKVCKLALEELGNSAKDRMFKSRLYVELASTYGQMANRFDDKKDKLSSLKKSHEYSYIAFSLDSQMMHPIDVISWTSGAFLDDPSCTDEVRLEIASDVSHAFNLADAEGYVGNALTRLLSRKEQIYSKLGDVKLSDDAFDQLLSEGSCLGLYSRTFNLMKDFIGETNLSEMQRQLCGEAYDFLYEHKDIVKTDPRCNFLMLRAWWMWKTGRQITADERSVLPFQRAEWLYLKDLLDSLLIMDELSDNLKLRYLKGLALFHVEGFSEAIEIFRELDNDSQYYGRRIINFHLWSDNNGNARVFNGHVVWINNKGRGELQVVETQRRVPFFKHETGRTEVSQGDSFNNFKISFNYRGPKADFK